MSAAATVVVSDNNNDIDNLVSRVNALRNKATAEFTFKGTRKVRNAQGFLRNSPDKIILPGRKSRPYAEYIKEMEADPIDEIKTIPYASSKLAEGKNLKTLKIRRDYFIPLEMKHISGWLDNQKKYVDNLSIRDLEIIKSYTSHGDILVNGYCRGNLGDIHDLLNACFLSDDPVPLAYSLYDQYGEYSKKIKLPEKKAFLDEDGELSMSTVKIAMSTNMAFFRNPANIKSLLEQFKQDLIRIISASPRLKKPIVVYRGIQSESHLKNARFKNNDFMSTTLDPFSVLPFTDEFTDEEAGVKFYCCVYEMTIEKLVPCMYMQFISNYANEFEVLLPPGMNIALGKEVQIKLKPKERTASKSAIITGYHSERVLVVSATVSRPLTTPKSMAGLSLNNPMSYKSLRRTYKNTNTKRKRKLGTRRMNKYALAMVYDENNFDNDVNIELNNNEE